MLKWLTRTSQEPKEVLCKHYYSPTTLPSLLTISFFNVYINILCWIAMLWSTTKNDLPFLLNIRELNSLKYYIVVGQMTQLTGKNKKYKIYPFFSFSGVLFIWLSTLSVIRISSPTFGELVRLFNNILVKELPDPDGANLWLKHYTQQVLISLSLFLFLFLFPLLLLLHLISFSIYLSTCRSIP